MPTMRRLPLVLAAVALAGTAACGSSGSPSSAPSPTPSPTTPSPTPTLPPVATDKAAVKAALVHATDLGKPWVEPKSVNRTKTAKGDLCPGKKADQLRVPSRATADVSMTEGTKQGAAIASYSAFAYDPAKLAAWRTAFATATKDCASYKAPEGTYVVTSTPAAAVTVSGADAVLVRLERIYAEAAHKTLYYVRQTLKCVVGRYVVTIEHAFIQPKTDPTGADLTKTVTLMEKQVAKARAAFAL
jgi:hypothetical protein